MKIRTAWRAVRAIGLAFAISGCGTSSFVPGTLIPDTAIEEGDPPFGFEDDTDGAMAALPFVENELLVQPYPGADADALNDLYASTGSSVISEIPEIGMTVLQVPTSELAAVAAELTASGLVEGVHKDYLYDAQATPNDPMFTRQPHLAQIGASEAWDITVGSAEIVIGIVDTGVDIDHPDIGPKVIDGWNVYSNNADFDDLIGHGTQAAGVAAAISNNATGVAGVAWESPIVAVRVTNATGQASSRDIAVGILWASGHGARIINVSFAPLWSNSIVRSAAQQAYNRGSLVVISAGNNGGLTVASGYAEAVFVGAITGADAIASFSDRGPFVDLVAPGTGIRATSPDAGYQLANGTSFSAPIVSGVAALAWAVNPDLRPATIATILYESAADLGAAGRDVTFGHGAVSAVDAVLAAGQTTPVPDVVPPTLSIVRPAEGTTLSSRYAVMLQAADAWGIADVVMSVDGLPFATDPRAPFAFVVDPASFGAGAHVLSFVATDLSGNASVPAIVTVEFAPSAVAGGNNVPEIVVHEPMAGAVVSGDVAIRATVSAAHGLATIEWLVDGESSFVTGLSGTMSGVAFTWRTTGVERGRHTITLVVTDAGGRQAVRQLELIL